MSITRYLADAVVPVDNTRESSADEVILAGGIDVDHAGRIVAVGPATELPGEPDEVQRLGGLLMPGLVNCHAHTPMVLMRSAGDGLPLERWLVEGVWPREAKMSPEDAWWGMALGSVEMLRAGVTSSVEMYLYEDQLIDAVNVTGARLHMMAGIVAALMPDGERFDSRLAVIGRVHDEHHDPGGRIRVGYGPHSPYDLDPGQLRAITSEAVARNAVLHIHLEETQAERAVVMERHGVSATQLLADTGVLDADVLAAHAVWLDDVDRRLLGNAGAGVATCPQSNLKLGSGIADVAALLAAGVRVGVGTDGPASNDDLDLWEELRLTPMLARGIASDPTAMTAATALRLATSGAAAAAGIDDVGSLTPGAWADFIRVDLDQPAFQPGLPDELFSHLVWAGSSQFVTDVWVAGRQVVADGEVTTLDRHEAQAEVRERARALL